MLRDQTDEIRAYRRAIALGLVRWDLFLNLGLAYLGTDDLEDAISSLQLATLLGPGHSESHFSLALAYERRGMLDPARREMLVSL
jgi:Flp pilus assembly protein TadD